MQQYSSFIAQGLNPEKAEQFGVYPKSVEKLNESVVFMADASDRDVLVVSGKNPGFQGEEKDGVLVAELTHENAKVLRSLFPYTAPKRC